jgi:hypothetical protein
MRGLIRLAALLALAAATAAPGEEVRPVTITREDYRGWPDTIRIANDRIEARIVTAIGPRIIDLRAAGGENLFHVRDAVAGGAGVAEWVFRGGWRLWVAPERRETTYVPDNAPCQVEIVDDRLVRVSGPPQPAAGERHERRAKRRRRVGAGAGAVRDACGELGIADAGQQRDAC